MNLSGNHRSLIEKVTAEVDAQGIKSLERVIHRRVEEPKRITKSSDLASLIEHTLLKPQATQPGGHPILLLSRGRANKFNLLYCCIDVRS